MDLKARSDPKATKPSTSDIACQKRIYPGPHMVPLDYKAIEDSIYGPRGPYIDRVWLKHLLKTLSKTTLYKD